MTGKLCSHQRCMRSGEMGMGWGLGTGLVQWYCPDHFAPALTRLSGLLTAARRTAATRQATAERPVTAREPELVGAGL